MFGADGALGKLFAIGASEFWHPGNTAYRAWIITTRPLNSTGQLMSDNF
jgi:hypothetical protein